MNAAKKVLVVDDEPDIRELLALTLERMSLTSVTAPDLRTANDLLASESFDLCLTDMQLPDGNGIDLVSRIQRDNPQMPVAVITAHGSMDSAVRALKAGAFDFVAKPVRLDDLRNLIQAAMRLTVSNDDTEVPSPDAEHSGALKTQLLGTSAALDEIRALVGKLARSQAPVFINGESGTGKELVAHLIHEQGPRKDQAFVAVNCGAIPGELMESEFFGHKKGSFTGAHADKAGFFQAATGGTLFLDEVADLPLPMQVKLLRAVQEKAVRPIGESNERPVDVRILSATHKSLPSLVKRGEFRQDLYYRLNVIEVTIPPLRDRVEDIEPLVDHLLARVAAKNQRDRVRVDAEAMAALKVYAFPGNVRELENILERAITMSDSAVIGKDEILLPVEPGAAGHAIHGRADLAAIPESIDSQESKPTSVTAATNADAARSDGAFSDAAHSDAAHDNHQFEPGNEQLTDYVDRLERQAIEKALSKTKGNKTAAAKLLGITFRALRYKLDKLTLD